MENLLQGEKELLEGMYLIVLPDQKYFDIILTEQNFNFTTNLNDIVESMTFKNSVENPFLSIFEIYNNKTKRC